MCFGMQQLHTAHIDSFISETVVSHRDAQANANEFVTFNGSDVLHKHVYSFYSDEENIYNITGNIIGRTRLTSY